MDLGDGFEIDKLMQLRRVRPLLDLVERYEQYDVVRPTLRILRDCIMNGLFVQCDLECAFQLFYNILRLGNIEVEERVDLVAQAAINPAVGAEGARKNEALPVPAAGMEKNQASLAKDPWDHQGLPLPAVNVNINLPPETDRWWESDPDSDSETDSDCETDEDESESDNDGPEPEGSRSPPREEADESGPVVKAPDLESSSPEPESSRKRKREENDIDDSQENRKRFRYCDSGNELSDTTREDADESGPVINAPDFESSSPEPESSRKRKREENDDDDSQENRKQFSFFLSGNILSDTTSESEDDEHEDTVPSPSTSPDTEQKKRKRDDGEEDNGRDRKVRRNKHRRCFFDKPASKKQRLL